MLAFPCRKDVFMDYNQNQERPPYNGSTPPGSDPYRQGPVNQRSPRPVTRPNGFATASLVLGICAFVSVFTMTVLPPVILGSLSLILGLLSRGSQKKMHSNALAGVIVSASALVINLAICIFSFYTVFSNPEATKEYWNMVNQTYEQVTGMSFDEILESYGIAPDQFK